MEPLSTSQQVNKQSLCAARAVPIKARVIPRHESQTSRQVGVAGGTGGHDCNFGTAAVMRWQCRVPSGMRDPPIHIRCRSMQRRYGDRLALRDIVESPLEALLQILLVSIWGDRGRSWTGSFDVPPGQCPSKAYIVIRLLFLEVEHCGNGTFYC
jgi:hypothetical protein